MVQVPSNLIPSTISQLQEAPVASENSLLLIVYNGVNYKIRAGDLLSVAGVPTSRQVIAGTGLTGGGQLSSNVTLSVAPKGINGTLLADTGVTPGVYGDTTNIPVFTVDSTGRVTAATTIPVSVSGYVPTTRQVIAGTGLGGGGALSSNVTLTANLSDATPLVRDTTGSAGVSNDMSRADHQHPAVDLSDDDQVDNILGLNNGGTARSLVMQPGAVIWSGADGLYVGPAGSFGQVLVSGGTGAPTWGTSLIVAPVAANYVFVGPASGPNADPTFRLLVNDDLPVNILNKAIAASTIDSTVIGGTTPAAVTGTSITATTQFDGPGTGLTGTAGGLSIGGNAATATAATNVAGGGANRIVYNTAAGASAFISAPTVGSTILEWSGAAFQWSPKPVGTVTAVGLTLPGEFTVTGSPVTGSGTLAGAWAGQAANYFFAAPNGTSGTPVFRAIVAADVPTLNQNTTGQAGSVANALSFNSSGGAAPGATFNGAAPIAVDYGTVGASPLAGSTSLTTVGTVTAGTWNATPIANNYLANSAVTVGTTAISLGGTSLTLGGLTSVAVTQDPTQALQLATKQYVDAVAEGLHVHASCAAATTGTLASITGGSVTYNNGTSGVGATLTLGVALTVLDGYTLQNGDRVLVKNEATQANNGIYTWATGGTVLTRATDFDTTTEIASGDFTFVSNGTLYADTGWVQTNPVTTVGTSSIVFVQFSGAGTYTAGTGLTLSGTQFSITNTGVSAATYGSASSVPTIAVNAQGQITSASNTSIAIDASQVTSGTVDATRLSGSYTGITGVGTLTAGTWNASTIGVAYGGTGLTAGTSGGVPYYSATNTLASSGVLAANALVVGGGAGAAPATIATGSGVISAAGNAVNTDGGLVTQSGTLAASSLLLGGGANTAISSTATGTGVVTALGINIGTAGAFVVNGGALGTPASGTVTNLTGTASININGTVGATTPTTGAFTTISASGVITSTVSTGTAPFTVASTTQVANLNAATAGTATNAVNFAVTDDTTTNATMYPVWVTANTGNLPARVTSTKLSFNPSTGALTATGGIGGGTF